MYASKVVMEVAPNVHLLGVFTMAFTIVYRKKALYPIYTYVLLNGIFTGFATWWIPYLYLWTILWGRDDAASAKYAEKNLSDDIYGCKRRTWIFIWNTLCTGAGNFVRTQSERYDCVDHCRAAVGFCAWCQ